jgi:Phytanoyl-CoA dioxygenase (PhyH)
LDLVEQWNENGFFCIPGFMDDARASRLQQACDSVLEQVRREHERYGQDGSNIAGLTDLRYFRADTSSVLTLLEFIASPAVLTLLRSLDAGEPLFHNTQYFHEQTSVDWDGSWHRDTQFDTPDPERERERMQRHAGLHFRVAFEFDDRLQYVRGSHNRWDTEQEFSIRKGSNPTSADMPNRTRIVLNPGDACVFHAWGIHRGTYRRRPRRTFDVIYSFGPEETAPSPTCFADAQTLAELSPHARAFFERFVGTYRGRWSTA